MGTESTRRYKVEWIKEQIDGFFKVKPKGTISKKKLAAQFALQTYSTTRTGIEIIHLLKDTDYIKVEGDIISK